MNILVVNCGSSSLKYQCIDMKQEQVIAKGLCERIGIPGSVLVHQPQGGDKVSIERPMDSYKDAIAMVLEALIHPSYGVMASLEEIEAVGHRVVHGGERFAQSVAIDEEVLEAIRECNDLAPLHNPANLIGICACREIMKDVPMVAVFDTAFHQTLPPKAYLYGIPYAYYTDQKVRRYGFHGTSHQFVANRAAELLGDRCDRAKVIVCHLGNGASVSAVNAGKCVDTSMGMTPLQGLMMGTRSGDIDPAIIGYLVEKENISVQEVMHMLNHKSGVLGLSGISSDFRDVQKAMEEGNERARLALEVYSYQVAKYIGAYVAAMNGVDAIVFTAGIGENNSIVRAMVCEYLGYLGTQIDPIQNAIRGEEVILSKKGSSVVIMAIPTNEELTIARETKRILQK